MDDFVADIDRGAVEGERPFHGLDRPHHAGAKTPRRAEHYVENRLSPGLRQAVHLESFGFGPEMGPPVPSCQGGTGRRALRGRGFLAYITLIFPLSPTTTDFARKGGRSTREIYHGDPAAHAESHRCLAGGKHRAVVRAD